MSYPGVAALKVTGSEYPLFKKVVMLNEYELRSIVRGLKSFSSCTNSRQCLYNAWLEILRSYLGGLPDEKIRELTLERVHSMCMGLEAMQSRGEIRSPL